MPSKGRYGSRALFIGPGYGERIAGASCPPHDLSPVMVTAMDLSPSSGAAYIRSKMFEAVVSHLARCS